MAYGHSARHRDEADLVVLELVRHVTLDAWALEPAVAGLLGKRPSRHALRLAQGRVLRARAERASVIADRAAEALAEALSRLDTVGPDALGESLVRT